MIRQEWLTCKNILVVRADNMGDVLMSSPAIRALKESIGCKITLLTSSAGALIAPYIDCIDELIKVDLPWIKSDQTPEVLPRIIQKLQEYNFDAVVIFTVFSQNPLPAALLMYMAGIPLSLAYCRENPYHLLSDWIPDKEPYDEIKHQVIRDLQLVGSIGCSVKSDSINIQIASDAFQKVNQKISSFLLSSNGYVIFHPGVSEEKRQYPVELWIDLCQKFFKEFHLPILLTGSASESVICNEIAHAAGSFVHSCAGMFSIPEFIALLDQSALVVSVNTGTIHICAAIEKPVIVLYADTNPQHTPWKVPSKVFVFPVDQASRSKNEVIQFLYKKNQAPVRMPDHIDIIHSAKELITLHQIPR